MLTSVGRALGAAAILIAAFTLSACRTDPNEQANKMLVEAQRVMEAAEKFDPVERVKALRDVEARLKAIVTELPMTNVAVQLASGQGVGRVSIAAAAEAIKVAEREVCATQPTRACLLEEIVAIARSVPPGKRDETLKFFADPFWFSGQLDAAEAIAKEMQGELPQRYVRSRIIQQKVSRDAKSGRLDGASALAEQIADPLVRGEAHAQIASAYAEKGEHAKAIAYARAKRSSEAADLQKFVGMLKLVQDGRADAARELAVTTLQRTQVEAVHSALSGDLGQARDRILALGVAEDRRIVGSNVVNALSGSRKLDLLAAWAATIASLRDLGDEANSALAMKLAEAKRPLDATRAAEQIGDPVARAGAFIDIASTLIEVGDKEGAVSASSRALAIERQREVAQNQEFFRDVSFQSIAVISARLGRTTEAIRIARMIGSEQHREQALAFVAGVLAETGTMADAEQAIAAIRSVHNKAMGERMAAVGQARAGRFAAATKSARSISDVTERGRALCEITEHLKQ